MSSLNKEYWRSLEEYCGAGVPPALAKALQEAGGTPGPQDDGLSRRRWLQLMGASLALAGAGGCRWEKAEILPFAKRPPGRIPGKVEKFATAMELGGSAMGLMVTCVDGRPIKIEGNPKHPASLGATDAFAQAAILELYDPDRSQNLIERMPEGNVVRTWDEFAAFAKQHFGELRKTGGEGFAVLSEPSSSPTLAAMRKKLLEAFPKAKWCEYEPITHDIGSDRMLYDLDRADVVLSIDADLFGTHPNAVRYAHDFAIRRSVEDGKLNRLYVVESCYTITGAMADHRLALRNDQLPAFLAALDDAIQGLLQGVAQPPPAVQNRSGQPGAAVPQASPWGKFAHALARDLAAHGKRCAIAVGQRQPDEMHYRVEKLTNALGAGNKLMSLERRGLVKAEVPQLRELVADINGGRVQTLLILGGDPVYNAPADLDFVKALGKVNTAIHLSAYANETSLRCAWHLPRTHMLESWGDGRAADGTYAVVQPMIEPLWGAKSPIELLALIVQGKVRNGRDLVRAQFQQISLSPDKKDVENQWQKTLHDGFFPRSQYPSTSSDVYMMFPVRRESPRTDLDLELIFQPDSKLYDGRFANNGWLQEMPDPMTKLTWDNAALMSPATAEKLGVQHEDVVKLKFKGREVEAPVYVMPGQADGTVAVSLGYGRTAAGKVGGSAADGIEPVGFDAYKLRTSDAMWFGTGLTVEPTGKRHRFATTHDHFWIDKVGSEGRTERVGELAREMTLAEYQKQQDSANISPRPLGEGPGVRAAGDGESHTSPHGPHPNPLPKGEGTGLLSLPKGEGTGSLWQEPEYKGRRWGMTIDLSKCVGCGACVIACQAENNVPVVGKERVLRGREMHWLRIDRYFQGEPANPKVVFQPLPCQQCELAPCEQVCPVGATAHSKEGLNDQAYNRCLGVRYCANNCPFKVRRFNFFNYHKDLDDPANEVMKMAYNPQVTVRSRGVMEKCTYCVQRIQAAKIDAKNHRRATIPDGQIKTACQQACPTAAIVFGDLNDRESQVAKQHQSPRAYQMLAELNIKPRTSYLARIRNPNPELEGKDEG